MRSAVGVTVLALSLLSLVGCHPHRFYDGYYDHRDRYDQSRYDRYERDSDRRYRGGYRR
jgi:hypothetical protein